MQRKQQLNPELLNMLKELDDGQFFGELIGIFLDNAPKLILKLEQAIRADDHTQMQVAAHKLKGSCANIGAETMAELASFLEKGPIQLCHNDSLAMVERIRSEFRGVRQSLEIEVKIQAQKSRPSVSPSAFLFPFKV